MNGELKKGMSVEKVGKGYWVEEVKVVGGVDEMVGEKDDRVERVIEGLVEELEWCCKG